MASANSPFRERWARGGEGDKERVRLVDSVLDGPETNKRQQFQHIYFKIITQLLYILQLC